MMKYNKTQAQHNFIPDAGNVSQVDSDFVSDESAADEVHMVYALLGIYVVYSYWIKHGNMKYRSCRYKYTHYAYWGHC